MSVVDQLDAFLMEHKDLAADPLAAAAHALAEDIDAVDTAANFRAPLVTAFQKVMVELRAMSPAEKKAGKLDELQQRRATKLRKPAA